MELTVTGVPAFQPALLFMGSQEMATPVPFGDGLLGLTGFLTRIETRAADASGSATWTNLHTLDLWNAGDTRAFQIWYRDPIAGPCGSAFNLSSGLRVTFEQ